MKVEKVPSHVPARWIQEGRISLEGYIVNNVADAAAEIAATVKQPADAIIKEYRKWQWVAQTLALRIAVIEEWHWKNVQARIPRPVEVPPVEPCEVEIASEILEQQREMKHWVVPDGAGWTTCLYCRRRARTHKDATWKKACQATIVRIGRIAIPYRDKDFKEEENIDIDNEGDSDSDYDEIDAANARDGAVDEAPLDVSEGTENGVVEEQLEDEAQYNTVEYGIELHLT